MERNSFGAQTALFCKALRGEGMGFRERMLLRTCWAASVIESLRANHPSAGLVSTIAGGHSLVAVPEQSKMREVWVISDHDTDGDRAGCPNPAPLQTSVNRSPL